MTITVVCPTLNESENVSRLIRELEEVLRRIDYEIIIVDDDSPDRTWAVAEEMGQRDPRIRVLRRKGPRSLGWSVIEGFSSARGEVIACMDADLQHDPAILPRMVEELLHGSDLVVGSRYVHGGSIGDWRWTRRFESRLATKLAQWVIGIRICDPMSGYFLLRRADFLRVRERLNGQGFKILLEIASNMRWARIGEIPYTFRNRMAGKTKLSQRVVFAYLSQLWRLSRLKTGEAPLGDDVSSA
jgi:dolichol-phosphate mannosyltransferase